ncbi:efflux RND transporter periplasmic adaptor subunit [Collinsella sp. AGMB00827]|uniref:Efflux RND transporter periplasmic adaptor subunit n=1 Tax=Collinsella ureilytica TaxID=2869515 RepID=A0ABS7MHL6_9ACTN|nr:efflux RND transporter periplasmic adaptor subunit [Collinsella urealyticum]MBY4796848.1 efflux RND transporter periplasmic adaptor subunit [Collinsella urealyticum]
MSDTNEPHIPIKPQTEAQNPVPPIPPVPSTQATTKLSPPSEALANVSDVGSTDDEVYAKLKAKRAERRRRKIRRRAIIGGFIAAVIILLVVLVHIFSQKPDQLTEPVVDMATRGEYTTTVRASGSLEPLSATVITPEVTGTFSEVDVVAGQTVQKGDVVLKVKNDDLDRTIAEAQRALKTAKRNLAAAREAEDMLNSDDTEGVDEKGATATANGVEDAKAAVEAAQATLDQAIAQGDKRTVTSPLTGSVVAMNARVGAPVVGTGERAGEPPVMIADLSQMKVTVQVDEANIAKVAVDQEASVTFAALPELTLSGKVTGIASIASNLGQGGPMGYHDPGGAGATFAVDILIPEPDPRLKPGMSAQVSLITERIEDVIMVPVTALQTDDGEHFHVNVQVDPEKHTYESREVTVVAKNEDMAVIGRPADVVSDMPESPVADGEALIISGGTPVNAGSSDHMAPTGAEDHGSAPRDGSSEATAAQGEADARGAEGKAEDGQQGSTENSEG